MAELEETHQTVPATTEEGQIDALKADAIALVSFMPTESDDKKELSTGDKIRFGANTILTLASDSYESMRQLAVDAQDLRDALAIKGNTADAASITNVLDELNRKCDEAFDIGGELNELNQQAEALQEEIAQSNDINLITGKLDELRNINAEMQNVALNQFQPYKEAFDDIIKNNQILNEDINNNTSTENQESILVRRRLSYNSDTQLISDYVISGALLAQDRGNPMSQAIFNDTQDVDVLNLADSGHADDDHFLSLLHRDTIDRARRAGFKDIVMEAGDISDMTDMFDEYATTVAEFAAGQEQVEITLSDKTRSFTEIEYKAHIFGVLRDLYSGSGWSDNEEASKIARATMDTLEYAASQDIRLHAIGAPMQQANEFISNWVEDYEVAKSLPPEDRSPDQENLVEGFKDREPRELIKDAFESAKNNNSDEFRSGLNSVESDFANEAFRLLIADRIGDAPINHITADAIQNIIEERQDQGFTNPRVLHMHGAGHFVGDNDIDNLLENQGISTQTIGFSGAEQLDDRIARLFNQAVHDAPEIPQKWYIAPTGEYGDITMDNIQQALGIIEDQAPETPQEDIVGGNPTTTTGITQ